MTQIKIQQRAESNSNDQSGQRIGSNNTATLPSLVPTLQRILSSRGVNNAKQIDYSLNNLLSPKQLTGINDAVDLLAEAISADASIVIVGDFDADGATSCALAMRCLRAFGLHNVSYLVPNRFEYGYGLSPEIVGVAALRQPDIIITVDNGISSVDGVHAAQQLGMSVLITDHHLPGEELPTADVIVNPNLPNDRFPSKNLAGVGVIFYVMLALRTRLRQMGWFSGAIAEPNMSQFLDLVALGTVADVVPLDQNNRLLVQQGLQRIRQGKGCYGIQALLTVSKRNPKNIVASDLGFAVGPRLNAAGRLDDMAVGIECLLADNEQQAMALAMQLDELNLARRDVEQSMQQDALTIVEKLQIDDQDPPVIYSLYDPTWHQGVVGLVASRIKEQMQRPVVALAPSDQAGELKGSCRSVAGIHIRDLLARVDALYPDLINKFGGHAMAAGLSLDEKNLGKFQNALTRVADDMTQGRDWSQVIWTDGALTNSDFNLPFAQQLRDISPWGQGFEEPVFEGRFKVLESRFVGEVHAKLVLQVVSEADQMDSNGDGEQIVDAIHFSYLSKHEQLPEGIIDIVYQLDINEFRDQRNLQLIVRHLQQT